MFAQKTTVAVFHVFKLRRVNVGGMQLQAHLCKFLCILSRHLWMVARGARIRLFPEDAVEADSITAVLCHYVITGFWRGDAHVIHLSGELHLVQRLLDLAWEIEFQHHRRIGLVVVAFAIGASAGEDVVVKSYFDGFHDFMCMMSCKNRKKSVFLLFNKKLR